MPKKAALALAGTASELYVCRGQKAVRVDLKKEPPPQEELAEMLLGPTGNLRAPTFRAGRTLVVGFGEETYRAVLG